MRKIKKIILFCLSVFALTSFSVACEIRETNALPNSTQSSAPTDSTTPPVEENPDSGDKTPDSSDDEMPEDSGDTTPDDDGGDTTPDNDGGDTPPVEDYPATYY